MRKLSKAEASRLKEMGADDLRKYLVDLRTRHLEKMYTKEKLADIQKNIDEKNALQLWLEGQSELVSAVLAIRIGFRVLPFVVQEPIEGKFKPKQSREIASALRYLALGRLKIKRCSPSINDVVPILMSADYSVKSSAAAAVREAAFATPSGLPSTSPVADRRATASRVAQVAVGSTTSPAGPPWDAIAADRAWIEAAGGPMGLLDEPMWLDVRSLDEAPGPHAAWWKTMRAALDGQDESWKVWTDWYEDRLLGVAASSDEIECLRVTLVPDALARIEDSSDDGRRRWRADIETNRGILKGSPRKANRAALKLIDDLRTV